MVLNLDKFRTAYNFTFESEALGRVNCNNFTANDCVEIEKWTASNNDQSSEIFARFFITLVCRTASEDEPNNKITTKQASQLNSNEINHFSRKFIEVNNYLVDPSQDSTTSNELTKNEGESDTDYLMRLVITYVKSIGARTRKQFENLSKNFSTNTLNLLDENRRISSSLGSSLKLAETLTFTSPNFPENPVIETNRKLNSFGKEFEEVALLIQNLNNLGIQLAMESAIATARARFWNNVMFGLGLLTLVVTALFSYLSFDSGNQSSKNLDQLLNQQKVILNANLVSQQKLAETLKTIDSQLERQTEKDSKIGKSTNEISNKPTAKSSDIKN